MIAAIHGILEQGLPAYATDGINSTFTAFSFRQVVKTYTGPLFRVRRASDNAELDIPIVSGYADTALLSSFLGAADGFVSKWYDQKQGFHATTNTLENQPKIIQNGFNGKLTARFAGAQMLSNRVGYTIVLPNSSQVSVNCVVVNGGITEGIVAATGTFNQYVQRDSFITGAKFAAVTGGSGTTADSGISATTNASWTATYKVLGAGVPGEINQYINGNIIYNNTVPLSSTSAGVIHMGAWDNNGTKAVPCFADLMEVIQMSSVIPSAEAGALGANQNAFYNLY